MSKDWKLLYYEDDKGDSEVFQFIESQKTKNKAKILGWLSMLEEKGPILPRPYADLLRDGIHEIRIKLSGNQVRILYFFCFKDFIVLSNCFTKNTSKVPNKEIEKAISIKTDFLSRYTKKSLMEEYNENL
jgi:hypothetical protein